jgi:hypothetical protein
MTPLLLPLLPPPPPLPLSPLSLYCRLVLHEHGMYLAGSGADVCV